MKIINELAGSEIKYENVTALYTGFTELAPDKSYTADEFEKDLQDRIILSDIVLHELNLLGAGYQFWAKVKKADNGESNWYPVRKEY